MHTKLKDRSYHHQKAVEQAKKRKTMAMYDSEEDEYFDGAGVSLSNGFLETRDQENSEEENEDRYDERRENYHTQRIQHEEEPAVYKDVAERLALERFRRRADLQPEIYRNRAT